MRSLSETAEQNCCNHGGATAQNTQGLQDMVGIRTDVRKSFFVTLTLCDALEGGTERMRERLRAAVSKGDERMCWRWWWTPVSRLLADKAGALHSITVISFPRRTIKRDSDNDATSRNRACKKRKNSGRERVVLADGYTSLSDDLVDSQGSE